MDEYSIRRGTTPPVTVVVDRDLTGKNLHLSFLAGVLIVKENADLTITVEDGITTIATYLTQEETLSMSVGACTVQLRAFNDDGTVALATDIGAFEVERIQEDGFLPSEV